jgi:DNA-binding GntR family transcriptional regulator
MALPGQRRTRFVRPDGVRNAINAWHTTWARIPIGYCMRVSEMSVTAGFTGRSPRLGKPRLRRESSADQVAAHIRQSIIDGELRKGDRLRQDDIAAELGVSRIPVREAIIALDREGWVQFEANRGAFVTGLAADDIRDHYELRGFVFGLTARRVAETATEDQLEELEARAGAVRAATDSVTFATLNERFLAKLLGIADSPRLRAALLVTPSILPADRFFEVVPLGREIQVKGIGRLAKLLRARRADEADLLMRETLRQQGDVVVSAFAKSGLLGSKDL